MKNVIYTRFITSPIGIIIAACDDAAITLLDFVEEVPQTTTSNHPMLLWLEAELTEYFQGKRSSFTLPLAPRGTQFQENVWSELQNIPYGTTISYAKEAKNLGHPKAVRAVANANGKNPISILIPCHRVIATSGKIGGYSGGLWRKEFLLQLERGVG